MTSKHESYHCQIIHHEKLIQSHFLNTIHFQPLSVAVALKRTVLNDSTISRFKIFLLAFVQERNIFFYGFLLFTWLSIEVTEYAFF